MVISSNIFCRCEYGQIVDLSSQISFDLYLDFYHLSWINDGLVMSSTTNTLKKIGFNTMHKSCQFYLHLKIAKSEHTSIKHNMADCFIINPNNFPLHGCIYRNQLNSFLMMNTGILPFPLFKGNIRTWYIDKYIINVGYIDVFVK